MKPSIEEIKQYVYSHIAEVHTIKNLAEHFQMSGKALKKLWKRSGQTTSLGVFITKVRLSVAQSWHRQHPEALCKELALRAGYRSYEVASRSVERLTGRSTRDYFRRC